MFNRHSAGDWGWKPFNPKHLQHGNVIKLYVDTEDECGHVIKRVYKYIPKTCSLRLYRDDNKGSFIIKDENYSDVRISTTKGTVNLKAL